jgi:Transglycosylase SLT domain
VRAIVAVDFGNGFLQFFPGPLAVVRRLASTAEGASDQRNGEPRGLMRGRADAAAKLIRRGHPQRPACRPDRRAFLPVLVWLVLLAVSSVAGRAQTLPAGDACGPAIAAAEQDYDLPAGLLAAIGRVETGRFDPATLAIQPWPWSVDSEGIGRYFPSEADALAAVRGLEADGFRSIDVGCLQVNLEEHPRAFATLEQAFDPQANAAYAARFLRRLHAETGSWTAAAAAYHSRTPEFALPYQRLVLSLWNEGGFLAAPWSGAGADDRVLPAGPVPPLRPFAPPKLADPATPADTADTADAAAPLLEAAGACAASEEVLPAGAWELPPARPCGDSPFSTTGRLLRLLAGHPPAR